MTIRSVALALVLVYPLSAAAEAPPSFAAPKSDAKRTAAQKSTDTARAWLTAVAAKDGKALAALFPEGDKLVTYLQQGPGTLDPKSAKTCAKLFKTKARKA